MVQRGFVQLETSEGLVAPDWQERLAAMQPEPSLPQVGDTLDRCLLLEAVGEGLSGAVFRAWHHGLASQVAVKVLLRPELVGGDEARLLARLRHPNIVRVLDAVSEGPTAYLVLEWIDGLTLRDALKQSGALRPDRAHAMALAICDALDYADREGLLHHDVKPDNVLLRRSGEPVLADLGLAAPTSEGELQAGTPLYLAPERTRGSASVRSDIYSLGVTIFEALTGGPPRSIRSVAELSELGPAPSPRDRQPAVSAVFAELVRRMVDADPTTRPESYAALRAALLTCPEAYGVVAPSSGSLNRLPPASLSGELQRTSLAEVIQFVLNGGKSGLLRVEHAGEEIRLFFSKGRLTDASGASSPDPEEVVLQVTELRAGRFAFHEGEALNERPQRIKVPTEMLLLEAARRCDERQLNDEQVRRA